MSKLVSLESKEIQDDFILPVEESSSNENSKNNS